MDSPKSLVDAEPERAGQDAIRVARVAALGTPDGSSRKVSRLVAWWRFFWMRRSGARTAWALALAVPALLAAIYLALSASDQAQVALVVQWAGQSLGAVGLRIGVEVTLAVCSLASLALLLAPGYRQYRYLHLPTSIIAPISVYVDAENIRDERILKAILTHLRMTYLSSDERNRLRADLLFFMDAKHVNSAAESHTDAQDEWRDLLKHTYKKLIASGFQFINSPHNPSGKADMAEAADREIALHAFERALLGGITQEFVIVSGDGDYAPLIYRLIALGHSVQVWTWGKTKVYGSVRDHIPSLEVVRFSPDAVENNSSEAPQQGETPQQGAGNARPVQAQRKAPEQARAQVSRATFKLTAPPHVEFAETGMGTLYYAIHNTVRLCDWIMEQYTDPQARLVRLGSYLGGTLKAPLSHVGFSGPSAGQSWLRCLIGLEALEWSQGAYPARGPTADDDAARRFFDLALATALAAMRVPPDQNGEVRVTDVLAQLVASDRADAHAGALQTLQAERDEHRAADMGGIVRCARALKLLQYDDAPGSPLRIRSPQLTALALRRIEQESAVSVAILSDTRPDAQPGD